MCALQRDSAFPDMGISSLGTLGAVVVLRELRAMH